MSKGYVATEIQGQCSMCLAGTYPNTIPVLEIIPERTPSSGSRVCRKCGDSLRRDLNQFLKGKKVLRPMARLGR